MTSNLKELSFRWIFINKLCNSWLKLFYFVESPELLHDLGHAHNSGYANPYSIYPKDQLIRLAKYPPNVRLGAT